MKLINVGRQFIDQPKVTKETFPKTVSIAYPQQLVVSRSENLRSETSNLCLYLFLKRLSLRLRKNMALIIETF
jgi:hypothetical protein